MTAWEAIIAWGADHHPILKWMIFLLFAGFMMTVGRGVLQSRKIQPSGINWRIFRHEVFFAAVTLMISGAILGWAVTTLTENGTIQTNPEAAAWWVLTLEFLLYFFAFDTYFYWLHRLMHTKRLYPWLHQTHHRSMKPNILTTLSVNPLESIINGGFIIIFTSVFTVHESTMALIFPVNILMGLYVHCGYEFLPRWWNKTWLSKWFITTTFHDQHHRYFKGNYGGYTTIWDWLCGTVRPNYLSGFEKVTSQRSQISGKPIADSGKTS